MTDRQARHFSKVLVVSFVQKNRFLTDKMEAFPIAVGHNDNSKKVYVASYLFAANK